MGTGSVGTPYIGYSVALSDDGNTLAAGAMGDNSSVGATWVFTRSGGTWTQQGSKLVGTGGASPTPQYQGRSVSLSSDGNILAVGGNNTDMYIGATWIFTRSAGTWTQVGNKLVGTGYVGTPDQGTSVSLSGDGLYLAVGGDTDNTSIGATWVFKQ